MAKVAIIFNFGSEYRQLVSSGFTDLLRGAGHSIEVMSRHKPSDFWIQTDFADRWRVIPEFPLGRISSFIVATMEKLYARKLQGKGLKGWDYGRLSKASLKERISNGIQKSIAELAYRFEPIEIFLNGLSRQILGVNSKKTYRPFLIENPPDLLIVTVPRLFWQSLFLSQAKSLGVRTVCLYHTNKDAIVAPVLDHEFDCIGVWNAWMREVLLANNRSLDPAKVKICGCAHFDCLAGFDHRRLEHGQSQVAAIPDSTLVVLYSAADPALFKSEFRYIRLVSELIEEMSGGEGILVVRLNPMDDTDVLENLVLTRLKNVEVSRPAWYFNRKKNICVQQPDDVAIFLGLLCWASVCVGLASTVAIDCAVTGLPFINIGFELPDSDTEGRSPRSLWDADFYKTVRMSGAATLVDSPDALKQKLEEYAVNRHVLAAEQQALVSAELGGIRPGSAKINYFNIIADLLPSKQSWWQIGETAT